MAKRTKKKTRRSTWNTPPRAKQSKPLASDRPTKQARHEIEFIARGVWQHGSAVLLCQNTDKGYYYLPGGHVEFGESAAKALEREFLEESGQTVKAGRLLLVTEGSFATRKREHHEINLVFHVEHGRSGGKPPTVSSKENGIDFAWVDHAAIVDLDVRPNSIKAWLAAGGSEGVEWVSEMMR